MQFLGLVWKVLTYFKYKNHFIWSNKLYYLLVVGPRVVDVEQAWWIVDEEYKKKQLQMARRQTQFLR